MDLVARVLEVEELRGDAGNWVILVRNEGERVAELLQQAISTIHTADTERILTVESTRSAQALLPTRGKPKTVVVTAILGSSFILSIIPSMLAIAAPRLCPVTSTCLEPVDSSAARTVENTISAVLAWVAEKPSCSLTSSVVVVR